MKEYEILACVDETGVVRRKFIYTKLELSGLSESGANDSGFVLSEDGTHWVREVTQDVIDRELRYEPNLVSNGIVSEKSFPNDCDFRGAWVINKGNVSVDMDKARVIHMNRIRESRNRKLKELDIETMKGIDVQSEKQILRDIPETFDLSVAETPESLKELWPEELGRPND